MPCYVNASTCIVNASTYIVNASTCIVNALTCIVNASTCIVNGFLATFGDLGWDKAEGRRQKAEDGLTSQIRRSAVSVAANIAEGYGRQHRNEYIQFLHIALGSLRELDTELIIASSVSLADKSLFIPVMNEVEEMQSIMVSTLNKLKEPKQ